MTDENQDNQFAIQTGIDVEAVRPVYLVHPTTGEPYLDDKGEQWRIDVRSSKSETYKRKVHEIQGRYTIKAKKNTGPNKGRLTYAQEREYEAEIYAGTMADWHIGVKPDAPALKIKFTSDNAKKWCMANEIIRDQILSVTDSLEEYLEDKAGNFTKKT